MPVTVKELNDPRGNLDIELDVSVLGMVVTISGGDFRVDGEDFTLDDDYEHTMELSSDWRLLSFFLVRKVDTGVVEVAVDEEVPGDGAFTWSSSEYEILHHIAFGNIPPDITDLAGVDLIVLKVKDRTEEMRGVQ